MTGREEVAARIRERTEKVLEEYIGRAYAVQEERGAVSVAACVSREDIEVLERAMAIATFARTLGTMLGMPAHDAAMLDHLIGNLGGLVAQLDDPETNWRGDTDGR